MNLSNVTTFSRWACPARFRSVKAAVSLLLFLAYSTTGCTSSDSGPAPASPSPSPAVATSDEPAPSADAPTITEPAAGGWGNLTMRFIFDGDPPAPNRLTVDKDVNICGKHNLVDESLLIAADGSVANVVVWLADKNPQVHPSYADSATATVTLDNKGCRFEPHICVVRTGQTFSILNSDPIGHNTKLDLINNPPFNQIIPAGASIEKNLTIVERLPATVACNIHTWMTARLVVQDHPYVSVSNEKGEIHFENLPTGKLTFMAWHEAFGYVSQVTIDGSETSWRRGKFEQPVSPGDNDMGEIHLTPRLFEK